MRVLILSQYYDPEPIPKPGDLARELRARGHDVEVLTGLPHYPSGRLAPGYALRFLQRETRDGIVVTRVFEFPYHGRSVVLRLLNYWSFAFAAVIAALFRARPDVIYVWHPPTTSGVAAWLIALLKRAPFVHDIHDVWSESAVATGFIRRGMMFRMIERLERFVCRRAARCIVHTEGVRADLAATGMDGERITVLPDWVDEALFARPEDRDAVRARQQWQDRFVVTFAGNFGKLQRLDAVVEAAARLDASSRILLALIGDGIEREAIGTLARERRLESRVQLIDRQPLSAMPSLLAASDALLVHLTDDALSLSVIPSKTLAYLAAARPVVMAMGGEAARLIEDAGCGIVVPPCEPAALARAFETLAAMPADERLAMGERGRRYVQEHLARTKVMSRYEALLGDAARRS